MAGKGVIARTGPSILCLNRTYSQFCKEVGRPDTESCQWVGLCPSSLQGSQYLLPESFLLLLEVLDPFLLPLCLCLIFFCM